MGQAFGHRPILYLPGCPVLLTFAGRPFEARLVWFFVRTLLNADFQRVSNVTRSNPRRGVRAFFPSAEDTSVISSGA
jgi:hypothetical protein